MPEFSLQNYRSQLADLRLGKRVGPWLYFHTSLLEELPEDVADLALEAAKAAEQPILFNVVKISVVQPLVSLLSYPDFFKRGFPVLESSVRYDRATGELRQRDYTGQSSRPVLHRKELLLSPDHPQATEFNALTESAEHEGLFEFSKAIGTERGWSSLLREKGLTVAGNRLLRADGSLVVAAPDNPRVRRHKTALVRSRLSVPMQLAERYGFFDRYETLFDFGCGKGDDIRALSGMGMTANGWDPHYQPDGDKVAADIVNLGFVLNVIESPRERANVLQEAFSLARQALIVGVLAGSPRAEANFRPYRDGFLTSRGTFQRYFSQPELLGFVERELQSPAHSLGTGVVVVFKTQRAESDFLGFKALARPKRESFGRRVNIDMGSESVRQLADEFWSRSLELGRIPHPEETEFSNEVVSTFGSFQAALSVSKKAFEEAELELAGAARRNQMLVDFALARFDKQEAFKWLPESVRRDIRYFFGSITKLRSDAEKLLFSIAEEDKLLAACIQASNEELGYLSGNHNLQLHATLIDRLPPILRVYAGCAERLLGSFEGIDLLKIHIRSGKVSTLSYDDFDGEPIPRLRERIKINLWKSTIEYFDYIGPFEPRPLYLKSLYMTGQMEGFETQELFDRRLLQTGVLGSDQRSPSWGELHERLSAIAWMIRDFELIPTLSAKCSRHFTFRDLVECGETFASAGITNIPEQADSYDALSLLAEKVLDPVFEEFGSLNLTYGFSGAELSRKVARNVAPRKDQHAACEVNSKGNPICDRGGAACDFSVDGVDSWALAVWVARNTQFDRIYFYDLDRPIHVSVGPQNSRAVTIMKRPDGSRGSWKTVKSETFLEMDRAF